MDTRDGRQRTALLVATAGHSAEVARVLVEAGADVNLRDDRLDTPFLLAGAEGDVAILRLTAPSADVTLLNRFGGTALIPAAERGHVEAVRFLVESTRVDVNHVNNLRWTALLEAIVLSSGGSRHQEVVRLLLAHGADPNIADRDGVTPLGHARARGYREIASALEAAGGR
ncbi:MAG: ankyrin repeat domain-containing protein [Dehalococcoidia bacterium]